MNKKFVKYPRIPYLESIPRVLDNEGYLFEKLDGGLAQIRRINGEIVCGSKANYLKGRAIGKSKWFSRFVGWAYNNSSLYNIPDNTDFIIFGEWLPKSRERYTVKYSEDKSNKFYFIDLGFVENNELILYDYNEAVNYLKRWEIEGMEILNPIASGNFDESNIERIVNSFPSQLGAEHMEGIVFKNYERRELVKSLHPKCSELRKEMQGLERYLNDVRVKKALRRLEETRGLRRPSEETLAGEITADINSESGENFSQEAVETMIRIEELYFR